jgi:hypothetical protein
MVKREDALEYEYAFEYLKCGGTAHARRGDSVGEKDGVALEVVGV